jgi:Tfp pilus assembly PilM family ATPase
MNQFTEEELQQILMDMNSLVIKYGEENVDSFYLELINKTKRMIEDYDNSSTDSDVQVG